MLQERFRVLGPGPESVDDLTRQRGPTVALYEEDQITDLRSSPDLPGLVIAALERAAADGRPFLSWWRAKNRTRHHTHETSGGCWQGWRRSRPRSRRFWTSRMAGEIRWWSSRLTTRLVAWRWAGPAQPFSHSGPRRTIRVPPSRSWRTDLRRRSLSDHIPTGSWDGCFCTGGSSVRASVRGRRPPPAGAGVPGVRQWRRSRSAVPAAIASRYFRTAAARPMSRASAIRA